MPRSAKIFHRPRRWLAAAALLALAPKCLLCVLGYAGIGAALGFGGREFCGAPAGATGLSAASAVVLATLGAAGLFMICRGRSARITSELNPPVILGGCWKQTAHEFHARWSGFPADRFSFRDWRRSGPTPQNDRS